MMKNSSSAGLLAGLLLLTLPSHAAAVSPGERLEDFFRKATTILVDATSARAAEDDIRRLAQPLFDVRSAARRVIEPEWSTLSVAEREEFIRLFGDRLLQAYLGVVRGLLPRDRPPAVRLVSEAIGASGRVALVRTVVPAKGGADVRFDYVMARAGGSWRVHDVVVDGVSLVENYRAQIAQVLQKSSYAGLVARLRGRAVAVAVTEPLAPVPRLAPRREAETP